MGETTDLRTERADRAGGVDQVDAARDWLRRHGVDPGDAPEPGPASGVALGGGRATKGGPGTGEAGTASSRSSAGARSGRRGGRRGSGSDADPSKRSESIGPEGPDADPEEVARQIVLRKLAAQARTRVELERALKSRAVPEDAAAAVLDRMDEVGLIDDAAFARDWVASRQQRKHLSRTALRRELQTKGVDRDLIDDALADVAGADEHRAALDLASRRAATMGGLPREVAYRRLGGVLARRGFSSSVTTRVLAEVLGSSTGD